jgi:hypothetical protein
VAALLPPPGASAQTGFEFLLGGSLHLSPELVIEQRGEEALRCEGPLRSEPLRRPIYWALRVTRGGDRAAWGLELLHDKVVLADPPDEVQVFSITHGLNGLTLQRVWRHRDWEGRIGAGPVLAHAESEVRHERLAETGGILGSGYYLTGPAVTAGAGRRLPLGGPFSLTIEARGGVARVAVPVAHGEARFIDWSLHLLAGVGFRNPPPDRAAPAPRPRREVPPRPGTEADGRER